MQFFDATSLLGHIHDAVRVNDSICKGFVMSQQLGNHPFLNESPLFIVMDALVQTVPMCNSACGVGIVGLTGTDIVTSLGVLGHTVAKDPGVRVSSAKQEEGPAVMGDPRDRDQRPLYVWRCESVKFNHVKMDPIFNPLCHLHSNSGS